MTDRQCCSRNCLH